MKEAIDKYIKGANQAIRMVNFNRKKDIILNEEKVAEIKKEWAKKYNLSKPFFISSDKPQNVEDIEILKKVLEIDKKIVYVTDDIDSAKDIKSSFPDRVIGIDEHLYVLAFIVDIHIFLRDMELSVLQRKYNKVFNPVHPKKYPSSNSVNFLNYWTRERQKFIAGIYTNDIEELLYHLYSKTLSYKEIKQILNSFNEERFLTILKFAVNDKNVLRAVLRLYHKHNLFDNKIKQNSNIDEKNNIEKFIKVIKK